jgi:hypothetical protein
MAFFCVYFKEPNCYTLSHFYDFQCGGVKRESRRSASSAVLMQRPAPAPAAPQRVHQAIFSSLISRGVPPVPHRMLNRKNAHDNHGQGSLVRATWND